MAETPVNIDFLLDRPAVPENTFEIALVMGGTVSAGAYTAGAVDFLIEALDCWETAVAKGDPAAPRHNVTIKVLTGTSGGGVMAAILARALAYDFPHVSRTTDPSDAANNPLYQIWIDDLRLPGFLDNSDIVAKNFSSLLNPAPINNAAGKIAGFELPGKQKSRRFLGTPLRVIVTLTNLTGIPFETDLGNGLSQTYVDHADYAKFAVGLPQPDPMNPGNLVEWTVMPYPDEFGLTATPVAVPHQISWDDFAAFGMATGAFPIGFPPRSLSRPVDHYRYRVVAIPQVESTIPQFVALTPAWQQLGLPPGVNATYHFWSVDGGATDNEPIELARTAMSGYRTRSFRAGDKANRAVVLIDPFAGEADMGPSVKFAPDGSALPLSLFNLGGSFLNTLTQQTRYDTADLLLAADPDIYSRFMLTATRKSLKNDKPYMGGDALATSGLDAFIGFASEDYSRHDYFLGRQNCQDFLKNQFLLDKTNPIMAYGWQPSQLAAHNLQNAPQLPIIPLLGSALIPQTLDDWPIEKLDPTEFKPAIEKRFDAIVNYELTEHPLLKAIDWIVNQLGGDGKVADTVIGAMQTYIDTAKTRT